MHGVPELGQDTLAYIFGAAHPQATEEDNIVQAPAGNLPNNPINQYVIPAYPRPYFRGANGGVCGTVNSDGDPDESDLP